SSGRLEALGGAERVAALRALVEPTAESMGAAREATLRWIDGALRMSDERRGGSPRPRREDGIEALRALRSGAETIAALHLRSGDALGALADLDRTSAQKVRRTRSTNGSIARPTAATRRRGA